MDSDPRIGVQYVPNGQPERMGSFCPGWEASDRAVYAQHGALHLEGMAGLGSYASIWPDDLNPLLKGLPFVAWLGSPHTEVLPGDVRNGWNLAFAVGHRLHHFEETH